MEASTQDTIGVEEARQAIATGEAQAIDIRDKDDWLDGHVPGALFAADEQLEVRVEELSKDKPVVVVDEKGKGCAEVVGSLRERGFEASAMKGGMKAWKSENFTLQPSEDPDLDGSGDPESR
jgi:rhodanese-related sulfurtransferase